MEESYKNNTTSVQMLLTLASPNPYGYPECPAPQINQTLRWKMVFRVLGEKNCFSTKTFESLQKACVPHTDNSFPCYSTDNREKKKL